MHALDRDEPAPLWTRAGAGARGAGLAREFERAPAESNIKCKLKQSTRTMYEKMINVKPDIDQLLMSRRKTKAELGECSADRRRYRRRSALQDQVPEAKEEQRP